MSDKLQKIIAIDGPSGSGKSTMAKKLAQELSLLYINTGSMFRALSLALHRENINFDDPETLNDWLSKIDFAYGASEDALVVVNGVNLTSQIYGHDVSELSSRVSQIPKVRSFLLEFQRSLVHDRVCVMEGRDIGSIVFPQAFCKIFFTASVEVRAKRRFSELQENGSSISLEEVLKDVEERDQRDLNREVAPLVQAEDAHFFDTSEMTPDEVIKELVNVVKDKAQDCQISLA